MSDRADILVLAKRLADAEEGYRQALQQYGEHDAKTARRLMELRAVGDAVRDFIAASSNA